MNFEVNQTFEFKNKLREIEQLLKEYWNTHPEEHLDKPFRGAFSDELSKVINSMSDNFFEPLLTKGYLSENYLDYLKSNIAVQFHPKYSPALLHEHGFFEIIYVLEGSCNNYSGNKELELHVGDMLILAPGTVHALSVFEEDCCVINIIIRPSLFEKNFLGMFKNHDIIYHFLTNVLFQANTNSFLLFHVGQDPIIKQAVLNLVNEQEFFNFYQEQICIAWVSLIFAQLLNKHEDDMLVFNDSGSGVDKRITYIMRYIQQHYKSVTLSELSGFFGYSERHIYRLLKAYTNMGFQKIIQNIRINHAAELLVETDYSLETISKMVGYSTVQNFREAFYRQLNISPKEYRKMTPKVAVD